MKIKVIAKSEAFEKNMVIEDPIIDDLEDFGDVDPYAAEILENLDGEVVDASTFELVEAVKVDLEQVPEDERNKLIEIKEGGDNDGWWLELTGEDFLKYHHLESGDGWEYVSFEDSGEIIAQLEGADDEIYHGREIPEWLAKGVDGELIENAEMVETLRKDDKEPSYLYLSPWPRKRGN